MNCPFPGMDPYLENPSFWRSFHSPLIAHIATYLNEFLPERFQARIDERCYIVPDSSEVYPDVLVRRSRFASEPRSAAGSVALLEAGTPTDTITVQPEEIGEPFIEILAWEETERIVTVIEVLSPTNKGLSAAGRNSYREKQAALRQSNAHLLEIDLLRGGEHTVAVPSAYLTEERYGQWDYITCLHRAGTHRYEFWLSSLREPLPDVRVPLTEGHPDLILPLQTIFATVYRLGRFYYTDYSKPPLPPLAGDDATWANALLKEAGLLFL